MTDQPGLPPEERLPVPGGGSEVAPREPAAVDRFTAHPRAHTVGLSPERAAKIVAQSASARWVAFLAVTIVSLFVIVYYFYDLGVPGVANSSRLANEAAVQAFLDGRIGFLAIQPLLISPLPLGALGFGGHGCPVRFRDIWLRRL